MDQLIHVFFYGMFLFSTVYIQFTKYAYLISSAHQKLSGAGFLPQSVSKNSHNNFFV